jgi:hypothetical protein
VNLGSAGSAFNLAAQTSNDKVEDGVIKVGHLAEGNYKNHGWAYSSAESANCDWFFTTDNGILKKAKALTPMHIANPLSFFRAVAVGQTLDLEKGRRLPHHVGGHKVVFAVAVPPMRVKRPDSTNASRCQRHSPCPVHFSIDATRRGNARWVRHRVR